MLNAKNERELVYVVRINEILPIEGADRVEVAVVNGWRVMVRKGQFQPGDLAIYFEIDSKVPETEPFMFLTDKHFKVVTQRYFKGTVISQGLLMAGSDFGWTFENDAFVRPNASDLHEGDFLTKELGVTYVEVEDNARKANSVDKYKKMAQRHPRLFSKTPIRWLMRRNWGKVLMFKIFGKDKDMRDSWPSYVSKTDEERIQNMPWILEDKRPWIATEKIDGTSTTFHLKRGKGRHKAEFYVCSRNVSFNPDFPASTNIYLEMAAKYDIENVLHRFLEENPNVEWVTLQGESYGNGVQKRTYNSEHKFVAFNLIDSVRGRWNSIDAKDVMARFGIDWVPIVSTEFILPDTGDELLTMATGASLLDGGMREGLVFRSLDGIRSFKAVSNEYLMKFHG